MTVGSSNRLTNVSRMANPPTETHTHHQTGCRDTVKATNAIVITKAAPGSTSTANAQARICQGANAFCGDCGTTALV